MLLGALFLVGAGYLISTRAFEPQAPRVTPESVYRTESIEGVPTCLPQRGGPGMPHTLECAFGVRTDEGIYFALDLAAVPPETMDEISEASRVRFTGLYVPIEAISSNLGRIYDVRGVMRVDSVEILAESH